MRMIYTVQLQKDFLKFYLKISSSHAYTDKAMLSDAYFVSPK
jgi:hypothetical protein